MPQSLQSVFYAHESVSLEKKVDVVPIQTTSKDIEVVYEINKCADWIKSNNFQKVCLQFPDHLLPDSSEVAFKLQSLLNQVVYVLGDTAYESCCIDYVAAAHINADAIVHFGPICFSKTTGNVPYLNVYEKHNLSIENLKANFQQSFENDDRKITLLLDSGYIHIIGDVQSAFETHQNVDVQRIDELNIKSKVIVFVGRNKRKLLNIQFTFQPDDLYYFDDSLKKFDDGAAILKRRNYLIEKIKDCKTIGIIIGTLAVKNYLKVIDRLKSLIKSKGKKYYLISVGKPTVAKLANFQEIEIYVAVTCALSEIYESRDFYQPIVTPFDIELALNNDPDRNVKFSYDYNNFIDNKVVATKAESGDEVDVSLLTNKIRSLHPEQDNDSNSEGNMSQLALKPDGTVMTKGSRGAEFLSNRSWKGLENSLEMKEAELAKEGRSGTAWKYKNEPS